MAEKDIKKISEKLTKKTRGFSVSPADAPVEKVGSDSTNPADAPVDENIASVTENFVDASIEPAFHSGQKDYTPIVEEMQRSYLNYAMSVIVSRALPDIKDGLKPVHRRILYAMYKLGLTHKARFSKSAKVVGEVLGKYHPHGDSAVYDALVRMGQTFSMRYPLILGQGNFGSVDGDPPAAMRYTEAKMTAIAEEMLFDIDKDTIPWRDNFDGTLQEPVYLPAKLPNLLLMGAEGIAVGMATKIPPHNLSEVIDAIVCMIDGVKDLKEDERSAKPLKEKSSDPLQEKETNPIKDNNEKEEEEEVSTLTYTSPLDKTFQQKIGFNTTLSSLMQYVQGPDFPTGANIYGISEIQTAYATGKGKIMVRATLSREEFGKGKEAVIVDEIPYQVNKAHLVQKIAELVRDKRIVGISDLRDESDKDGIRIVIELKRDAIYKKILNNLYKHTELQTSYPVNMVALVDGRPQTVSLKLILEQYIKHRVKVITHRSMYELDKAKLRAHILEGLLKALDHIDEIIAIIKKSKNEAEAKDKLMKTFEFSDIQAQAILDMQLKKLTGLEREKIEDELKILKSIIENLESLLSNVHNILKTIKDEILQLKEKFGDKRKTVVYKHKPGSFTEEQLIENKEVIVTLTKAGYIKTVPRNTFKVQKRGGKGVSGMETKDEDSVYLISSAMMHDSILFFSDNGKVYQTRIWDIPQGTRISKGKAIVNILPLQPNETVTSILTYNQDDSKIGSSNYITMCTKFGTIKKTSLSSFKNIKSNGIIAIALDKGDQLLWSCLTDNKKGVVMATHSGKAIVFKEADVRSTGRSSRGVRGIRLDKDDYVSSMDVFEPKEAKISLIVLTENGIGKMTSIEKFPVQNRGGKGVKLANIDRRTGDVACSSIIDNSKKTLVITSQKGQVVKIPLSNIPSLSRTAKGVILMRFNKKDDHVASATFL